MDRWSLFGGGGYLRVDCIRIYKFRQITKFFFFKFRAEYGAFWKCVTSGCVYMFTQLAKMMFLATFFPASTDDEDELLHVGDKEMPFDFVTVSLILFL